MCVCVFSSMHLTSVTCQPNIEFFESNDEQNHIQHKYVWDIWANESE